MIIPKKNIKLNIIYFLKFSYLIVSVFLLAVVILFNFLLNEENKYVAKGEVVSNLTIALNIELDNYIENMKFIKNYESLKILKKAVYSSIKYNDSLESINNISFVRYISIPKQKEIKSYVGVLYILDSQGSQGLSSIIGICETNSFSSMPHNSPVLVNKVIQCPQDSVLVFTYDRIAK